MNLVRFREGDRFIERFFGGFELAEAAESFSEEKQVMCASPRAKRGGAEVTCVAVKSLFPFRRGSRVPSSSPWPIRERVCFAPLP